MSLGKVGKKLGFTLGYLLFLWERVGIDLLTFQKRMQYNRHDNYFGGAK